MVNAVQFRQCEVLRITQKRKSLITQYSIYNQELKTVNSAKYVGVHIDSKLNFNTHIDNTVKKGNGIRALALVQRNTQFCPRKTNVNAYQLLVRPVVEYALTIGMVSTHKEKHNQSRECSAQLMSDRHRTSSVTAMLESLAWPSLETRRNHARIIMLQFTKWMP